MVIIVHVVLILYGFLLFSPVPPIQPSLPRPPRAAPVQQTTLRRPPEQATTNNPQPQSQPTAQSSTKELHQLYTRVAARSLGEGAFALAEVACTIKNRLHVSRNSLTSVLRAYRAKDIMPRAADIEIVRQVFEGERSCPATWWYAISLQDSYVWQPHRRPPVKTIAQNERKQILIFDR